MTDLQVRRVRFDFAGDDVPFNWQPARPAFAMQCNLISFFAPGFEKFIVDATREGIPLIRDPEVAAEANAYLRQEAQHAAAHASHARALTRRELWNGNRETFRDWLEADHPIRWAWSQYDAKRAKTAERIGRHPGLDVVRLGSPGAVVRWVESIPRSSR